MPNKTIYVRESDLPLWDLVQAELGTSVSALFAEFLRERAKEMDAVVHVVRSAPNSEDFTVMFAPTKPNEGGSALIPHYVQGAEQVASFLTECGVVGEVAAEITSSLDRRPSVSVRTALSGPVVRPRYTLWFNPTCIGDSGARRLLKVDVVGQPAFGGRNRWVAGFHDLDQLINALENVLGLGAPQLAGLRRSLLLGQYCQLGGRVASATRVVSEGQLLQLGLVEEASPAGV